MSKRPIIRPAKIQIPVIEELRKSDRDKKQATPRSAMGEYIGPGQKGRSNCMFYCKIHK
jgi:hypothetical protein